MISDEEHEQIVADLELRLEEKEKLLWAVYATFAGVVTYLVWETYLGAIGAFIGVLFLSHWLGEKPFTGRLGKG